MQRKIYHGSSQILRTPVFGTGLAGNDFGLGFYCTESPALAAEWAAGRTSDGFVNQYSIETNGLRIINLNSPEYCILHWLSVLLNFREFDAGSSMVYQAKEYIRSAFSVDFQNCDCMVGFRADNCNFAFAQNFLDGDISYQELNDAVRFGDTGRQFVLKSNRAFDRVLFNGYSIARSAEVFPAAVARDRDAMERFESIRTQGHTEDRGTKGGASRKAQRRKKSAPLYVTQIVEENVQSYDPRLMY